MSNENPKIIGYCTYCKDPIHEGDRYVIFEDEMYEVECFKQMETYYDPMEDIEQ